MAQMRADRLLSLLMLLQTHGKMTAAALAEALEITERTVYRDVTALNAAGVPVYTERGPGGGVALVESYRTTLTGLTTGEVRALGMLAIPPALQQLGVSQELRAALLKLSAALPESRRAEEERTRQRILLDPQGWETPLAPAPCLKAVHQAVWEARKLWIRYEFRHGVVVEQVVCPYGLVANAEDWRLVYLGSGYFREISVRRLAQARLCDESFERDAEFDLAKFWQDWSRRARQAEEGVAVRLRVAPALQGQMEQGSWAGDGAGFGEPDAQGWREITLRFHWVEEARQRLMGFGGAVEVLEPLALRRGMQDYAEQILLRYTTPEAAGV